MNESKEVFGAILFKIDPYTYLYPLIQSWPTPSKTVETLILRKEGDYVIYLNELRHSDSSALRLKLPLSQKELPSVQAVSGIEGIYEGKDYRGIKTLSDIRKLANSDWYMVTKIDSDEVFEELNIIYMLIIVFVVSIVLLVVAGVAIIYNYRQKGIYRELYNSEKKLYYAQDEFKTTLYSIGDAVITTDKKGNIRYMNHVAESLTGWKEKKAIGKPLLNVFHIINEQTREEVKNPVETVLKERVVVGLANHTILISKEGKETPIADSGAPIKNEDGEITGVVLVFRDQTKEREIRKKIEESEKKFKGLFDSTSEGICLHEVILDKGGDPIDYIILDANKKYEEILNLKKHDIIGKKATEIYGTESAPYIELYSKVALTGNPELFETYFPPMEKHFSISVYSPEKGKFATVFQDITDKKLAEHKIKHQYHTLKGINESVKNAIFSSDRNYCYVSFNSSHARIMNAIYGVEIEEGKCLLDYMTVDTDRETAKKNFDRVFNGDSFIAKSYSGDEGINRLYFEVSHSPILNDDGKVVGAAVFASDLTDNRKMESKLTESESKFLSVYKNSPVAIAIFSVADGKFIDVNDVFLKDTGFSRDEVIGKTTKDLNVFYDYNERERINNKMMNGETVYGEDLKLINKKGDIRDCLVSVNIINIDGKPHFIASIEDITERKIMERTLMESEARLNSFMENVPAFVLIKDEEFRPMYANNKFKKLFPFDDWFMKLPHETFEKEVADNMLKQDSYALEKGYVEYEEEWEDKTGNKRMYYTQKFRIDLKDGGRLLGGIIMDITEKKKAEVSLKASEQRFSKAFMSNPAAMAISSLKDGRIFNINESYEKLMGYSTEDFKSKSVYELKLYEDNIQREEIISELNEKGFLKDKRINFYTKNGRLINTILSMERLELEGVDCILSTIIDITELERNKKLKDLQYKVANAVINSRNLYDLFETIGNELNILIDTSNFFAALYNEETDMLYATYEKGKEESVDKWKAEKSLTGIVVKQKKTLLLNKENIRKLADEGIIELIGARAESWMGVPLKVGNKTYGAIVIQDFEKKNAYDESSLALMEMIAHEISIYIDRKKAEEIANRLSKGIEQSPICIIVTDKKGNIEYVNPKFTSVTGYTSKEVIGKNPRLLKSGEQSYEFYRNLWETILSGKDWQGELHNKKKNGELFWESAMISPVLDETNNITHFIALKEDITEKKMMIEDLISAKEKAEEMNRLKSSFLANMSHELRTPLNGILGFAEILKDDLKDDESKNMAQIIFRSGQRLHSTLNQILDLTTLESSVSKVVREVVNINQIIEESCTLYKADAAKKNLDLSFESKSKEISLYTDKNILLNTINNLVDNAIKYTHEGSVTLSLSEESIEGMKNVVIEVKDTGIGIEADNLEIIFDEFRQASEGYGRSFEGSGLGLSICRKYMKLIGGHIKVRSEIYRGSTFRIEIPVSSTDIMHESKKNLHLENINVKSDLPIKRRKYDNKILYVENDIDNQTLMQIVFNKFVHIDIANDALEGIKMSKENDYSIILMDINLGSGMNGKDVTRLIRKNPKYKDIPIVAVTAFAMEGDREEFMESGCTHYLSKPFEVEEMQKLIFGLLEKNS